MRKADTISLLLPTPTLPYLETSTLCLLHWFSTWCSRKHKPVIAGLHPSLHTEIRGWVNTNKQEKTWPHLSHSGLFLTSFHWRPRNPTQSPSVFLPNVRISQSAPTICEQGSPPHVFDFLLIIHTISEESPSQVALSLTLIHQKGITQTNQESKRSFTSLNAKSLSKFHDLGFLYLHFIFTFANTDCQQAASWSQNICHEWG